nr:preprotein translocase subunit YajC [uncultured Butyricicoccus sp.]
MNWEVILWACGTVGVLFVVCALIVWILSARNMKHSREAMAALQQGIKIGAKVLFAGGIYGKIVKIKDDLIDVEVSKGTVIQISRYSIQSVLE